jgi:acetyl-CoA C-acetyltransferase
MKDDAFIIGWGHTVFGKHDQVSLEDLVRDAVQPALDTAGLGPEDIDGVFVGHFNAGFVGQDFTASLPAVVFPALRHTPAMRTENACATGSAAIAAKNHANGVANPFAHMRRDFGYDFCRTESEKNPRVAGPLKRSDCSLVSDGAAALVLSRETLRSARVPPVRWRSRTQVNDWMPMSRRDPTRLEGASLAWARGLHDAGVTLDALDFVETHDCFTIAELMEYEAMGLAPHGEGARVILDGVTARSGKLPVNPSGGLKSKGHPIGATGVSQHVMAAMQLSGTAQGMQVPGARMGAVFNMGGTGVANYLSVLQAA